MNAQSQIKRDERRAKMRALANQVGKMSEAQRQELAARLPGVTTIEGRMLSLHNQCLLAMQMPGATLVGGFRQWIKNGRAVRKGEHGACIWVPIGHKTTDENGMTETDEKVGFILGTVFDISQTAEIEMEVAA